MENLNVYDIHHSFDFLILRTTESILKFESLEKPREHFYSDFVNDIGIINLLRKEFLITGDFKKVFNLYQGSRLEPESHRYESLFDVLIITIVGNIISGLILELIKSKNQNIHNHININIFDNIEKIPQEFKNKFINGDNTGLKNDFEMLLNCYISRIYLENQLITLNDYQSLIHYFINDIKIDKNLLEGFNKFKEICKTDKKIINLERIFFASEPYSKGAVLKYLDEHDCEILYHNNIKTANVIKGMCASSGFVKGKIFKVNELKELNTKNIDKEKVLCIDSYIATPELIPFLYLAGGVITWNTGQTGHIPLACRGIKIGCIIIKEDQAKLLIHDDDIIISGGQGLIYTGLYVKQ